MLKQKEKEKSPSDQKDNLTPIRQQVISDIKKALKYEPKITNGDLSTEYQNWESEINRLNLESEINDFHEKVLKDIKAKRKIKQEIAARDEKINQARTTEEKINLLGEMGSSLGEHTPEQETKLEQIKDELAANPPQLREAIQQEIISQMTTFGVKKEDLNSNIQNQYEQLKSEQNPTKIREIEKAVVQAVGEKYAQQTLTNLEQQIDTALQNKNKTQIQALKDELLKIIGTPNSFLQAQKSQAQALLKKLEQGQQKLQNNTSPNQPEFP